MKVRTNVKAGVRDVYAAGLGSNVVNNTVTTGSAVTITDNSVNTAPPAPPV
jgi:hypothetical protein